MRRANGGGQEELPHVRCQGWRPGGATPTPLCLGPGAAAGRNNPMQRPGAAGRQDQPHVQGAVAAQAQEGLEELSYVEGQEGRR